MWAARQGPGTRRSRSEPSRRRSARPGYEDPDPAPLGEEPGEVGQREVLLLQGVVEHAQYDYLIPLELGGDPNDRRNMWVEPPSPGHKASQGVSNPKDKMERQAAALVCHHKVTLTVMQRAIATNWSTALAKVGYPDGKPAAYRRRRCASYGAGAQLLAPVHPPRESRPALSRLRRTERPVPPRCRRHRPCVLHARDHVEADTYDRLGRELTCAAAVPGSRRLRAAAPVARGNGTAHELPRTRHSERGPGWTNEKLPEVVQQHAEAATPARHDIDAVVFAGYAYDKHFLINEHPTARQLRAGRAAVLRTWRLFQAAGIRVIVTQDVPGMRPRSAPTCIAASHRTTDPCPVRRSAAVRPTLTSVPAQQNPDLAGYIPLDQYFCDAKLCHALIGGIVVDDDSHHLTTTYSKTLGPYVGSAVAKLLGW